MRISRDGWVSMPGPGGATGLHVRVRERDDGRVVITDLFVHGDEVTAETMRGLSIPRLEALLNATHSPTTKPASDDDLTMRKLRARGRNVAEPTLGRFGPRATLTRPDGQDPEAFYQLVAQVYTEHSTTSNAPAKAIASEAGVPVTTAHRWVREARRRGFLPPGRKGRAG